MTLPAPNSPFVPFSAVAANSEPASVPPLRAPLALATEWDALRLQFAAFGIVTQPIARENTPFERWAAPPNSDFGDAIAALALGWQYGLSHPILADRTATLAIRWSQANSDPLVLGWGYLMRALSSCRDLSANQSRIESDFVEAKLNLSQVNDSRGLRLLKLAPGMIAGKKGRWSEALLEFEALTSVFDLTTLDPDNFYLCFGLATANIYCGQLEAGLRYAYAGQHIASQLNLGPAQATIALPLAVALMAAEDPEESRVVGEAAAEVAEKLGSHFLLKTIRNNLAVAQRRLGRLDEAHANIQKILADPTPMVGEQHFAHFNAAECAICRGDLVEAKVQLGLAQALLARVVARDIDTAKCLYIEGLIASREHQWEHASVCFEVVVQKLPNISALRFNHRTEVYDEYAQVLAAQRRFAEAFVTQRQCSQQYEANFAILNRLRQFSQKIRAEIAQLTDEWQRESLARKALLVNNLELREAVNHAMAEAASLKDQASRDALTGLYNRRYLDASLPTLLDLAKSAGGQMAIVLVDLDHFKQVNDVQGHQTGDEVLRRFAVLAQTSARGSDVVGRYGGEEFCIALNGCGLPAALTRMTLMLQHFTQLEYEGAGVKLSRLTFSAGIAMYPDDGRQIADLLLVADRRLYAAKANGRSQIIGDDLPIVAAGNTSSNYSI